MLAHKPEQINIGEVVSRTEPNFHLVECFDAPNNTCPIASCCALIEGLGRAQQAFLDVLNAITLDIRPGEFVYLIGKTGSGKSSFMKTL